MKYVNSRTIFLSAVVTLLSACATGPKNDWNIDGSQDVSLVDTLPYLPLQELDENGVLLPYEAAPNPYAELSGRIDKQAVTTYIDARRAYQAKKYDFADKLLTQIIEQEPKLSGPWVMRGDIASDQQQLDDAIQFYAKAIEVNPINFNAYLRLAKTQRQRGHFSHAQNTYAKALALWSDGPELHLNLGVLYDVYLNLPKQAQAHMEAYELLSVETDTKAIAWLGEIKQRTGLHAALQVENSDGNIVQQTITASQDKTINTNESVEKTPAESNESNVDRRIASD